MTYRPAPSPIRVEDLPRFLDEELRKISDELSYLIGTATLVQNVPTVAQATTTPQILTTWNYSLPSQEGRTISPDLPNHALVLTRPGFYMLAWWADVDVSNQRTYTLGLYANGNPTQSVATNKLRGGLVQFSGGGSDRVQIEDVPLVLDFRYAADGNGQFDVERAVASVIFLGD